MARDNAREVGRFLFERGWRKWKTNGWYKPLTGASSIWGSQPYFCLMAAYRLAFAGINPNVPAAVLPAKPPNRAG